MLPITDVNGVAILGVGHLTTIEERFMDIATIVGLLAAFGLIFMAISENAPAFVDTASLLIVVAGSIAVVMARCSLGAIRRRSIVKG